MCEKVERDGLHIVHLLRTWSSSFQRNKYPIEEAAYIASPTEQCIISRVALSLARHGDWQARSNFAKGVCDLVKRKQSPMGVFNITIIKLIGNMYVDYLNDPTIEGTCNMIAIALNSSCGHMTQLPYCGLLQPLVACALL